MAIQTGQLHWRCRRGAKELDMLLTTYLQRRYADASVTQQKTFQRLLELPDPDLLQLLLGTKVMDDPSVVDLVKEIRDAADH
ncbi:MAG: succinate dehydrogenase assembly factor 2 [Gammaproteobacteria bacterium]|nr:succinate dehydrogenase assembly factor 2 [Gammaproteobacteria bacterium]